MGQKLLRIPRDFCDTQSKSGANFLKTRNKTSPEAPIMRTGTNSVPPRNNGGTEAALLVGSKPPLTRAGQSWSRPHPNASVGPPLPLSSSSLFIFGFPSSPFLRLHPHYAQAQPPNCPPTPGPPLLLSSSVHLAPAQPLFPPYPKRFLERFRRSSFIYIYKYVCMYMCVYLYLLYIISPKNKNK